jgi:hypothetical protein
VSPVGKKQVEAELSGSLYGASQKLVNQLYQHSDSNNSSVHQHCTKLIVTNNNFFTYERFVVAMHLKLEVTYT